VVITYLDIGRIASVVIEIEADPPLPVNANAPLPLSFSNQLLEHVSWWNTKILYPLCRLDQVQLCLRQWLHVAWEFPYLLAIENGSRLLVFE
jgi:hypothetical protein